MHYATSCRANGSCRCLFQWCTILLLTFSAFSNAAIHPRDTDYISAAWYTGWHSGDFPLSNVSWSKYTHMTYAFATTTPDSSVLNLGTSDKELLPHFVAQAHQHGVNASLAIGGWTGSRWFSSHVGSPENRTRFVTAVSNLIKTYELDGIDFDWEFPGDPGIGCNVVASNDTENYLEFLREFRRSPEGSKTILSLAVFIKPYNDSSRGTADLSEFNKVIDYVEIMNYDIKSSTLVGAGSSSPLDDSCAPEGARLGSAVSAVQAWMDAGITPEKIVLGVPSYGHSFAVSPSDAYQDESTHMVATYPSYNSSLKPSGDRWDGGWGLDVCGNEQGPGGIYTYWGLIDKGLLNKNGTIRGETSYRFDRCSQTPFAYNLELQTLVSFENAMSFSIKGAYIRESGLKGFAMWEAGGDYHDVLLDAIRR
ncbi:glycoside hydrolase family 18 protein [Amanita thiersii Skay4041]|uniref:Glycoside hydrolase family 18 protein n=1 Tax=Amanita thiersii Skay4041 TaxID=703135 RepID=A0A2A9P0D0_9AGAR|nr:glycoside hydrolase family 18 protein [Amanita thiersii Skay4041]